MASSEAGYGGSLGGRFRLHLDVSNSTVDTANNRSLVVVSAYITCITNAGHVFNFDPTPGNVTVNGSSNGRSVNGYDFNPGVGSKYYLMHSESFWITHNSDGTKSIGVSASHNAENSPFITTAGTSLSIALPTIQRHANITGFSVTNITDVGFNINVSTDALCNLLQYSLDGGSTWTQVGGDFSSKTVAVGGNLISSHTYSVVVSVRRKDSGLSTQSGTIQATTLGQGNFLPLLA